MGYVIGGYEEMDEKASEETLRLGGSIELTGFSELDGGTMIVLKKIIGNYAKKMSDMSNKFEKLSLHLKSVHQTEGSKKYQLNAKLVDNGKVRPSEVVDRNLFVAVDSALKKIINEIG